MRERGGPTPPELPEPQDIIKGISRELGLNPQKKPSLWEDYPVERLFPEEAPTADGRYLSGICLEEIYDLGFRHTLPGKPPGSQSLLSPRDVRLVYRQYHRLVEDAWQASDMPDPFPDFTLTHLLGATKRQIAHLEELKRFHETDTFGPALRTYGQIGFIIERTILDGDPDPQYLGDETGDDT